MKAIGYARTTSRPIRATDCTLDILDAGHYIWEERADEYGSIIAAWVGGGYRNIRA
jgi:hypothetical protein